VTTDKERFKKSKRSSLAGGAIQSREIEKDL
jgi:hypothetical protein